MSNNNRHEEIVIVPPTLVETQALPLITDTQYLENFTSESLNRTFLGIVSKGIFKGFNVELSGGLGVIIKRDTGLGLSIARYERDNYQISVRQQHDINLTFLAGKTSYAVIEAQYKFGVITSQVDVRSGINAATVRVIDESALASHHIVICKATVPDGATELDVAHITYIERLEGGFDLTGHQNHPDPHPQYVLDAHAATNDDIDNVSNANKFIKLQQLWRALAPIRDRSNEALNVAHSKWSYVVASTTVYGATKLSSATNSTSEALAATSGALKKTYDLAASKMTKVQGDLWYWKRGETVTNSTKLNSKTNSTAATGGTIAERDSSGDISARLLKSSYQDESALSGGLAFRKSTSDNFIRFCNNVAAIRSWLSVFSKAEGDGRYVSKSQVSSSTSSTSTTNVASSAAVKAAYDRSGIAGNKVYTGNSKTNVEFPIGSTVVYTPHTGIGAKDFNKHVEICHSTYASHSNYVGVGYTYQGAKLNGIWATRTRTGALNGGAAWLAERIL